MEKAEILARARALKGHVWAMEPEGEEAKWAGRAYGATFELTKPEGQVLEGEDTSSLLLTLKGKDQLRGEFVSAFGEPKLEWPPGRFRSQMLIWDATKAIQPQQSSK